MPLKTIGTIEILTAALLTLLTLAGSPRIELYVIAAALFISGHVLVASPLRSATPTARRDHARGPGDDLA